MSQKTQDEIYDAKQLGASKVIILGFQHMFAMFGATVLVPLLTGLDVSTTLLFAGIGTLLFHMLTHNRVPAFLGSSFAFLGGYAAIAPILEDGSSNVAMIPYACFGVACAGFMYLIMAALIKMFSAKRVMRFFPPIVTGPIIIAIGLTLSKSAIDNCSSNWLIALVAIVVVILCNIYGKGMIKIIPILIGVIISYVTGIMMGEVNFSGVVNADWFGIPIHKEMTVLALLDGNMDSAMLITSIITIMPIALATIVEHIGDISAISSTTGENYIKNPGLHRTLLGDGLATMAASLFGAPANTTYGENTGVLAITKNYNPAILRITAVFAILLSFVAKFGAVIRTIPQPVMGGISLILFSMIAIVGVKTIKREQVKFSFFNIIVIVSILFVGLSGNFLSHPISIKITETVSISGLSLAAIVGVVLNIIFTQINKFTKKDI